MGKTDRARRRRLTQLLRRVLFCPKGHEPIWDRDAAGRLQLVCIRCLTQFATVEEGTIHG